MGVEELSANSSLFSADSHSLAEAEEEGSPGGGGGARLRGFGLTMPLTWPAFPTSAVELTPPTPGGSIFASSVSCACMQRMGELLPSLDGACDLGSFAKEVVVFDLSVACRCRGGLMGGPETAGADGNLRRGGREDG